MKIRSIHPNQLKALIFDVDGTLTPSMPGFFESWTKLCLEHKTDYVDLNYKKGLSLNNIEKVAQKYKGGTPIDFIQKLFGKMSLEEAIKYSKERDDYFLTRNNDDIVPIKGLYEFLDSHRNVKKAIASSNSPGCIKYILEKIGVSNFFAPEHIVNGLMVANGKPHPEPFLKAAETIKVLPENCIAFEDSRGGIKAALSANMKTIGIATDISKNELQKLGVNKAIDNYTELQDIFNSV